MKSTTLYFKEGLSDKVYRAAIEPKGSGFVVNFAFGRRGSSLSTGSKTSTPVDLQSAEKIFDKIIREKKAKGYTEGPDGTPYTSEESKEHSGIQPQLLNPIEEDQIEPYVLNAEWVMQQKFDGRRMLLLKQGNAVRGINRKGLFCGVPETIISDGREIVGDFLVDGECVGDHFHAFDMLSREGKDLRSFEYRDRLLYLINDIGPAQYEHLTSIQSFATEKEKRAFLSFAKREKREGVVFKRLDGPYTPGRPSSGGTQLKCKFYATASFIVVGVNGSKRSVSLALFEDVLQKDAGNVTIPANHAIPKAGDVVEVRYLYAFRESGCVFQPVYLGKRTDVSLRECTVGQLKFKPEDTDEE